MGESLLIRRSSEGGSNTINIKDYDLFFGYTISIGNYGEVESFAERGMDHPFPYNRDSDHLYFRFTSISYRDERKEIIDPMTCDYILIYKFNRNSRVGDFHDVIGNYSFNLYKIDSINKKFTLLTIYKPASFEELTTDDNDMEYVEDINYGGVSGPGIRIGGDFSTTASDSSHSCISILFKKKT